LLKEKKGNKNKGEFMEKITLMSEDDKIELFILEETRISGVNYILASESEDDDEAEVYILKDTSKDSEEDAIYEFVEDDDELNAVAKVFSELLDDVDIK
jgi:hypothetical protein